MSLRQIISLKTKSDILSRDKFKCQKCGFHGMLEDLEVYSIKKRIDNEGNQQLNLITLCSICYNYAPDDEKEFKVYLEEKIDGAILNTFRKSARSVSKRTIKGMEKIAREGNPITRAPWGYKIVDKKLVPSEHSYQVQEVFQGFLNQNISLTKLAKKYGFSVNGLKKILTNQSYLGKVKFDKQTHQGEHQSLISSTLFNHVQNKLEKLGIISNH